MIDFSRIRPGDKVTVPFTVKQVDAADETILVSSGIGLGWFGVEHLTTHEAREIVVGDTASTSCGDAEVIAIFGDKLWCRTEKHGPLTFRRDLPERA